MSGEIGHKETNEVKNNSLDNFKDIKPDKEMNTKDVNDFWDKEFDNVTDSNEVQNNESHDNKASFDDNGTKYRDGDNLLPNNSFEINGYHYETDDKGRVKTAEGKLRMRDPDYVRNMEDTRSIEGQEYKSSDDRGHLIGHQFGGSDKLENLVPMDSKLNQGDFVKLENTLADAVKDGADVRLKVEPVYESDSTRPTEFRVTYSIDGDKEVTVFKNESEAKS